MRKGAVSQNGYRNREGTALFLLYRNSLPDRMYVDQGGFLKAGGVEEFAVNSRSEIQVFFKGADKVGGAGKTAFHGDGVYGACGLHNKLPGPPESEGGQVLMGRGAGFGLEYP